jgi:UDP-2,3-diacylglucosamine pyrophosphatase LpxH
MTSTPTRGARHTVVLSDVHLSQAHPIDPNDPLWMRYRASDYHPDSDFEGFVDAVLEEVAEGDALELVFNGDVFDFDAPLVANGTSTFEEYPLDDAGCAAQMKRILDDHPGVVRATAKLLARGHRLLVLSGNHDVELYFDGVRRAMKDVLVEAALAHDASLDASDVDRRIRFRTWFHVTDDRIYLEHGSQYDLINGMPDPMSPLRLDRPIIHPVCGKLAFKRLGSRMGYFNPYCEDTFYMGLRGYITHFWKHYMFSKERHIGRTWWRGAIKTAREIARHRRRDDAPLTEASIERAIEETGATREAVLATHALRIRLAERLYIPVLRELWLDRVFLVFVILLTVGLIFALAGLKAAGISLGVALVLFVAYELLTPKPDVRTYDSAPPTVLRLFDIHRVRAMCMGHTHRPFSIWETHDGGERFRGNSGSWCPAFYDQECTKPVLTRRPFLWLTSREDALSGGVHWYKDGVIEAGEGAKVAAGPIDALATEEVAAEEVATVAAKAS